MALFTQFTDQTISLLLLFELNMASVLPQRSLLLNRHNFIVVDGFESHLATLGLTFIVFEELFKIFVLVETLLNAVPVNTIDVLVKVVLIYSQNFLVTVSS